MWSHTGSDVVSALDWGADNTYFVIGGQYFLRFCYLRPLSIGGGSGGGSGGSSTSLSSDPAYTRALVDIEVREGKLVKNERAEFVALVCGQGALAHCVFALSKHGQGVVCVFTQKASNNTSSSADAGAGAGAGAAGVGAAPRPLRWEIEKWMDVRMPDAAVLSVHDDVLAVGGGDSKLRVFVASSLKHLDTLPKPTGPLSLANPTLVPGVIAA